MTASQRQRFRELQQKEAETTLSAAKQSELEAFVRQIESDEASYLRPATERIRNERLRLEGQTRALQSLLDRRQRLARRLERVLALSTLERRKIDEGLAAILNAHRTGATK